MRSQALLEAMNEQIVHELFSAYSYLSLSAWCESANLPGFANWMRVQAGEEIGWRGFALPRLADRVGLRLASLLLGVIWALWHLPQFYIADADTYHQPFIVWALQVVAMSVAFAWLYAKSGGSLLVVMLMHSAINNSKDIVVSGATIAPGVFSLHAPLLAWLWEEALKEWR